MTGCRDGPLGQGDEQSRARSTGGFHNTGGESGDTAILYHENHKEREFFVFNCQGGRTG